MPNFASVGRVDLVSSILKHFTTSFYLGYPPTFLFGCKWFLSQCAVCGVAVDCSGQWTHSAVSSWSSVLSHAQLGKRYHEMLEILCRHHTNDTKGSIYFC